MSADLVIENGRIVLEDRIVEGTIACSEGKIVSISMSASFQSYDTKINAGGKLILPGAVDEHVHSREPGMEYKDNFENATKGAVAGGVTTILEMPNTVPPVDSAERFYSKLERLKTKAYCDFGLYGVLNNSNADKFDELARAGVIGFKVFLGPTTGNILPPDDGQLYEIMSKSSKLKIPVAFHAENREIISFLSRKLQNEGRNDPLAHTESRPEICEEESVQKIALIAKHTGGIAHIVHVSAATAVSIITQAKLSGVKITCETCPQYLLLSTDDYEKYGNLVKINPPLRDRKNQEELWKELLRGEIDCIGSDHAPHAPQEKEGNVWDAAAGFLGVQTMYRLLIDSSLNGRIDLNNVTRLASTNPAKIFGLYPKKGCISVGSDADLVVVDPDKETLIDEKILYSKYALTPFLGLKLRGRIESTILRARIVYDGSELSGPNGAYLPGPLASTN